MKTLYITSLHTFSGKTALCLGLGRRLQADGYKVGYLKPLSTQPWQSHCGVSDEDAAFVQRMLDLPGDPCDLVGVVFTRKLLMDELSGKAPANCLAQVKERFKELGKGRDVMLLEGGASLREGFSIGLGTPVVAEELDVAALAVTPYTDRMALLDDVLVAQLRLGDRLLGVVANRVPDEEMDFVVNTAAPYLAENGITLLGALPLRDRLQAISVGELAEVLDGQFLTLPEKADVLIERLIVGAMSVEQALPRIRRVPGSKAIVTGGDRADMQLMALEAAARCLVLTGNLHPLPEVLRRAEECEVPVLLVRGTTMETLNAIETVFGKTRLGQATKLEQFESLLNEHFDFEQLYKGLGL